MGWDRKKRGSGTGYFYLSVRTPAGVRKLYFGRRTAGHLAAAVVEQRRQARQAAWKVIREERAATAEADRLAAELTAAAEALSAAWLVLTGHERRRGEWRKRRGKEAEGRNA
ncbi:hypothetical protein [Urbifossiella limnaea]|uniref:hypothetical protein n=1 Tax=Urbifossiella limnaea TaxID=2528023 RepID=UPI0011A16013|nr:hypothetical protein [Urbifossiella limnaea]